MQEPQQPEASFLPKAGTRAQSMINNSRPPQQHRTIKDNRSNSVIAVGSISDKRPALVPITNTENGRGSLDSFLQGGPAGLLKMEKAGSASENDTKDHLRRRIKELEKEVTKLTTHIHQAEQSIKNYRVSLSEKSPRVGSNSKECGAQTDPDDTVKLQAALKTAQDKLAATVEELRSLRDVKDSLFNERKALQEASRRKEEFLTVSVQAGEETISQLRAQLRELEEKLQSPSESTNTTQVPPKAAAPSPEMDVNMLEKMLAQITLVHALKAEILSLKKTMNDQHISMHNALQSDYQAILNRVARDNHHQKVAHEQELQSLELERAAVSKELSEVKAKYSGAHGEIQRLSALCESLQAQLALATIPVPVAAPVPTTDSTTNTDPPVVTVFNTTSTSTPPSPVQSPARPPQTPVKVSPVPAPKIQQQDQNLSPFSPQLNRTSREAAAAAIQADLQIQAKLRLAEKDAEIDLLQKQLAKERAHLGSQSDDLMNLRNLLLSERERFDQICSKQETLLAQRTTQCMNDRLRVEAMQQRLSSATQAVAALQEVHAAEVKAVKHEAHVKDLLRVAKEREAAIEKDRLQIEIKHIKEIQSILTFSLSTAEQSLNEVQPHTVVKLVQGREKRIKLLDLSTNSRRKDLDQRSADTCAVNSAHLDGFQKKAAANNNVAKEMTHAATKKLLALLREDGSGGDIEEGGNGEGGSGGSSTSVSKVGSSAKF